MSCVLRDKLVSLENAAKCENIWDQQEKLGGSVPQHHQSAAHLHRASQLNLAAWDFLFAFANNTKVLPSFTFKAWGSKLRPSNSKLLKVLYVFFFFLSLWNNLFPQASDNMDLEHSFPRFI